MLIKNLTRTARNTKGGGGISATMEYLFKYVGDKNKAVLERSKTIKGNNKQFVYTHNVRSLTIKGMVKEFEENYKNRIYKSSKAIIAHHTIVSFAPCDADKIDHATLLEITKKYIELRGENCLYVCTQHLDKETVHLHICQSNQINGLSSRISKEDFASLKKAMDDFQRERFPYLQSLPEHGKSKALTQKTELEKTQVRETKKERLRHLLREIYSQATSKQHLLDLLKENGMQPYYRGSEQKLTGFTAEQTKYRFKLFGIDNESLEKLEVEKLEPPESTREGKMLEELQELREKAMASNLEQDFAMDIN